MVYIFLADGFEDVEAFAPIDILRRASIETKLVGVTGMTVVSSSGISVQADCAPEQVTLDDCDMLVLPGGSKGVERLKESGRVAELVKLAHEQGRLIAAICAAPTILAQLGLLNGRRAVCYPSLTEELEKHGARVPMDETVTHDRHIITAQAAGSSLDFALKLVSMLKGWAAAETIRQQICYHTVFKSLT